MALPTHFLDDYGSFGFLSDLEEVQHVVIPHLLSRDEIIQLMRQLTTMKPKLNTVSIGGGVKETLLVRGPNEKDSLGYKFYEQHLQPMLLKLKTAAGGDVPFAWTRLYSLGVLQHDITEKKKKGPQTYGEQAYHSDVYCGPFYSMILHLSDCCESTHFPAVDWFPNFYGAIRSAEREIQEGGHYKVFFIPLTEPVAAIRRIPSGYLSVSRRHTR